MASDPASPTTTGEGDAPPKTRREPARASACFVAAVVRPGLGVVGVHRLGGVDGHRVAQVGDAALRAIVEALATVQGRVLLARA